MADIREIERNKYLANNNMHIYMANKKNELNNSAEKKITRIEREINFIQKLMEIINKKVTSDNYIEMPYLDYILLSQNNSDRDAFSLRRNNVAAYLSDLGTYFFNIFGNIFTEGVNIKINGTISNIQIFDKDLFKKDIDELEKQKRFISEYIQSAFDFGILTRDLTDKNSLLFIDILNRICDSYYNIGSKLSLIIKSHISKNTGSKYAATIINESNLENTTIPYHSEKIFVINTSGNKQITLSNKTIFEAIEEAMNFCFCVVYKFEYKKRKFTNTGRDESLDDKLNRLNDLLKELEELEKTTIAV